ncbi:AMP-binding protein, partial [Campylobacter lari]|uniref:AMP-binding protein n=1 Tax=Campylobacter lari TaxID=201 RepID=UPI001BDABB43
MITHIADILEVNVQKFPDKNCFIEFNGKSITYSKFDKTSKALASYIIKRNIYKAPVLVILPKCIDALISFFGIARSGNFYTIIDEKTPTQRIKKIIEVLQPKLLITAKDLNINLNLPTIYIDKFQNSDIDELALKRIKDNHIDTDLLYVFFTSGSTGTPKGVSITHKSVIDYIFWVYETFGFDEHHILANQAPLSFDVSVADILLTIKANSTLHLIPDSFFAFPAKIIEYFATNKINTIFTGPSTLAYFANEKLLNKIKRLQLNKVFFGGEIISTKHLNTWRKCLPNTMFINTYGPTEASVYCSYFVVDRQFSDDELLPIGKAYKNTQLLVFDENLNLITPNQVGIKGELYVRGTCLSLGYYNDKEKTKQAFVQNPLHDNYLDLLYKTG